MARRLGRKIFGGILLIAVLGGAWTIQRVRSGIEPTSASDNPKYVRFDGSMPLTKALQDLQRQGIIRDAQAMRWYAVYKRSGEYVAAGSYAVHPGMSADEILDALKKPVRRMIRIPETNWSNRTARLLEKDDVVKAADYEALVKKPEEFAKDVDFPLPKGTLEGYLWPDTYDLPPLITAREIIVKQLRAFEKKVWVPLGHPDGLDRVLTIASLIELEVAKDDERPVVSSIIENRLKKGMPLQIDATILFAEDRWHEPNLSDIRKTESPFNTYKHKGLPPTPICSPSFKSILAAMHPERTDYFYYVAMPDGHSLFARDMKGHEANIALRKAALAILHLGSGGAR